MGSGASTEEVKNHEMASADCPTTGDSLVFVLFGLGSGGGWGTAKQTPVRKAKLVNGPNTLPAEHRLVRETHSRGHC